MIILTLHNLHTWGKSSMTKAGDICVAASLAEKNQDKTVYVAATAEHVIEEVRDLYRDVKFEEIDFSKITSDDKIVVPILEFSRILSETRDQLAKFYRDLLETDAQLLVMNIHHNQSFYLDTLSNCGDEEIKDLVYKILKKCKYIVHDECMKIDDLDSVFVEQIVFYDKSKIKDVRFEEERDIVLTFYRPSRFKGFNLWLKETETSEDKLVAICNTSANPKYHQLVDEYEYRGLITVYRNIADYLENPCEGHALISAPYSIESEDFQRLLLKCKSCLSTTDYDVLKELNSFVPDYLILENAMFDASVHQLPLRWTESSMSKMRQFTREYCKRLNSMSHSEQSDHFEEKYGAAKFLQALEVLS